MALKDWRRWALLFAWLILFLVSLKAHTPWRDEYQSWLVSTRTPDLQTFFDAIRYERHPPLLYVLQRAFVSLYPQVLHWPPQIAIETMTAPFTFGAVFLLIFALNLPFLQSSLLIFSPYLLREFGVVSRCYALGLFFLMAGAAFGQRKKISLACAMLSLGALTHLLFTWICSAILILLALENRPLLRKFNFWLSGLIMIAAAVVQWPPADSVFPNPNFEAKAFFVALRGLNQSLWGIEKIWTAYQWNTLPLATDATAVLLLPALFLVHQWLDLKKLFLVCYPPILFVTAGPGMNTRSLGVAFFGFVACYGLFNRTPDPIRWPNPLTAFSSTALVSTVFWWFSWAPFSTRPSFNFSGTREFIAFSKATDGVLLVEQDSLFFPWIAETRTPVFDVRRDREITFPHFKKSEYIYDGASAWCLGRLQQLRSSRPGKAVFLGLKKGSAFPAECGPYEKVFSNAQKVITDEAFDVYQLHEDP